MQTPKLSPSRNSSIFVSILLEFLTEFFSLGKGIDLFDINTERGRGERLESKKGEENGMFDSGHCDERNGIPRKGGASTK